MNRESLNGTPAAGDAPARLHVCPTCNKPYPGKRRRCFGCKPAVGPGARKKAKPTRALRAVRPATGPDLGAVMAAADAARQAVGGLDPATARQVLGWVAERVGA